MEEPLLESSLGGIATGTPVKAEDPSRVKQREILESKVNPAAWKLELERVAPMLKVTVASNELREWRSRLEQLTTFIAFARDNFPESKANLAKISADVKQVLEKLASRERYFQSQLEHHISDYRQVMERNNEVSERHREASDKVNAATSELSNITDDLETIKSQMQDRGESYTDATPVQAIKTSIANIKEEIAQFDVRVAVLQQNLLQVRMKAQDEANRARKKAAQGARPAKV
jgi:estrogen-related receptor beta like 1